MSVKEIRNLCQPPAGYRKPDARAIIRANFIPYAVTTLVMIAFRFLFCA